MTRIAAAVTLATLSIFAATPTYAVTINRCLAGKLKGVAKTIAARTKCHAHAVATNAPEAACLAKAATKFVGASPPQGVFEKLESKYPLASTQPCLTFDDTSALDGAASASEQRVASDVNHSGPPSACDAAKTQCYGKYYSALLGCYAKAAAKTGLVDGTCLQKAALKLTAAAGGCYAKAVANGDCSSPGSGLASDRQGIEADIAQYACTLDQAAPPGGCAPCDAETGGFCWFRGATGDNCSDACAAVGRAYDVATAEFAGSGGTAAQCEAVMDDLGIPAVLLTQLDCMTEGVGCAYNPGFGRFQCTAPPTDAMSFYDNSDRVCACRPRLPCSGATVGGFCWYLGADGESCDAVCEGNGRVYDEATLTYAGSAGTPGQCGAVLQALGKNLVFQSGCGSNGLGCLFDDGYQAGVYCTSPDTTSTASLFGSHRACACH